MVGRILKSNDLVRHLTKNAYAEEGYDFIITLDKKCWDHVTDEDRVKILRHELRHVSFDIEADDNPYKLVNHSILDFYEEVELNQADPRWRARCHPYRRYLRTGKGGQVEKKEESRHLAFEGAVFVNDLAVNYSKEVFPLYRPSMEWRAFAFGKE